MKVLSINEKTVPIQSTRKIGIHSFQGIFFPPESLLLALFLYLICSFE